MSLVSCDECEAKPKVRFLRRRSEAGFFDRLAQSAIHGDMPRLTLVGHQLSAVVSEFLPMLVDLDARYRYLWPQF